MMSWLRNLVNYQQGSQSKSGRIVATPIGPTETRKPFCGKCGNLMLYTTDFSYNRNTGESYVDYWFNDCSKGNANHAPFARRTCYNSFD